LEEAVNKINALPVKPSFIIHTGDITHLSKVSEFDDAERIISQARLDVHYVPGEHDVLDEDVKLYRNRYGRGTNGAGWYSFDANGVHFIGLVNVVDLKAGGLGNLGNEQLEWLEDDLKSRTSSTPVVVFAHIPLWSVYPAWGWGTEDAARALDYLKRFGSVTVLNGHIHQIMQKVEGNVTFHTAMSKWQQIGCCGQLLRAQTVRLWIRVIRRCDRPLDHGDRETARLKLAIVTEPTADYPTVAYTLDGQHRPART
jgi:3',5'-cyclic AMP phosphodiesterase CpdA